MNYYTISDSICESDLVSKDFIIDNAKTIVEMGLNQLSINELSQILCNKLININLSQEEYDTLCKLNNNNYLQILKIMLYK